MYVVIVENHICTRTFGPFATAALASGFGFSQYGALTFGNPVKWRVKQVSKP